MIDTLEELPVIFRRSRRREPEGAAAEITAVFPTIPADYMGREMTCYAHVGQHSGCTFGWYNQTRAAKPAEYESLLRELEKIYGRKLDPSDSAYRLKVYRRIQPAHRAALAAEARRCRDALRADPRGAPWSPGVAAEAMATP
jgi:hypothetical protein